MCTSHLKLSLLLNQEKEQGNPLSAFLLQKKVNILKSLTESRICCWQMCEASQGNNPVAGHRNWEAFLSSFASVCSFLLH